MECGLEILVDLEQHNQEITPLVQQTQFILTTLVRIHTLEVRHLARVIHIVQTQAGQTQPQLVPTVQTLVLPVQVLHLLTLEATQQLVLCKNHMH